MPTCNGRWCTRRASARARRTVTALHISVGLGGAACTKCLLDARANVNNLDYGGKTALLSACELRELCRRGGVSYDDYPIDFDENNGFAECVQLLLAKRASPIVHEELTRSLAYCCALNHPISVEHLIRARAEVDKVIDYRETGATALCIACFEDSPECVERLLMARADVNKPNGKGVTPLSYACSYGYAECAAKLLGAGAPIDEPSNYQHDPIMSALARNHDDVIRELIAHTACAARLYNHLPETFRSQGGRMAPVELAPKLAEAALTEEELLPGVQKNNCLRPILDRQIAVRAEDSDDDDDPDRTYAFPPPVDLDAYAEACRLPPAEETEDEREARFQRERCFGL